MYPAHLGIQPKLWPMEVIRQARVPLLWFLSSIHHKQVNHTFSNIYCSSVQIGTWVINENWYPQLRFHIISYSGPTARFKSPRWFVGLSPRGACGASGRDAAGLLRPHMWNVEIQSGWNLDVKIFFEALRYQWNVENFLLGLALPRGLEIFGTIQWWAKMAGLTFTFKNEIRGVLLSITVYLGLFWQGFHWLRAGFCLDSEKQYVLNYWMIINIF